MRFVRWRTLALALGGAVFAGGLFAGYSWSAALLRTGLAPAPGPLAEQALAVAILAAGAGYWVAWSLRRHSRRLLDLVREQTAVVCDNPAPNVLRWASTASFSPYSRAISSCWSISRFPVESSRPRSNMAAARFRVARSGSFSSWVL